MDNTFGDRIYSQDCTMEGPARFGDEAFTVFDGRSPFTYLADSPVISVTFSVEKYTQIFERAETRIDKELIQFCEDRVKQLLSKVNSKIRAEIIKMKKKKGEPGVRIKDLFTT